MHALHAAIAAAAVWALLLALPVVESTAAEPLAAEPLALPLCIRTDVSFSEQFAYAPDYQRNVLVFDAANRPVIRSRTASQDDTRYVTFLEGGVWRQSDLSETLRSVYPDFAGYMGAGGFASDRVVVDNAGRLYTVLTIRVEEGDFRNVMLYSGDGGASWGVVELPFGEEQPFMDDANRSNVAIETPTGQRELSGPPFVAVWRELGDWPGAYATLNALYVTQPYWSGDRVVVPTPVLVTERFLGMVQSVGGTSFATTVGDRTFFTWTQVRDTRTRGTPTYVGVYDQRTGAVVQRVLAAWAHPVNDSHCTPAMAIDSQGIIHLVTGAHLRPFRYRHSVLPLDITAWTPEQPVLSSGYWTAKTDRDGKGCQTYASLVCTPDDTLHLVFRQERRERGGPFPRRAYSALAWQTRPRDGDWSQPQLLAYPAAGSGYTNFHQKLTLDRGGRLYLSFNVFRNDDTPKIYRPLRRFRYRMVWFSDDGLTWQFATTASMAARATTQ